MVEVIGLELDGVELTARLCARKRALVCLLAFPARSPGPHRASSRRCLLATLRTPYPSLCCFRLTYDFCRRCYRVPRTLWRSVYAALRMAFAILPLPVVHWGLPFSERLRSPREAVRRDDVAGA